MGWNTPALLMSASNRRIGLTPLRPTGYALFSRPMAEGCPPLPHAAALPQKVKTSGQGETAASICLSIDAIC